MEKTWRWFGKKDKIELSMLKAIGVEGIVSALHDIPNGEIWTTAAILDLKVYIEAAGLKWSVVESLPVSEGIKSNAANRDQLIDNYIVSLENLGKCGLKTICYNFMPVIDWIRTDLDYKLEDGTSTLFFDKIKFAYFELLILKRNKAIKEYSGAELAQVYELDRLITKKDKEQLIDTIIVKTQGFINGNISAKDQDPVSLFNDLLAVYEHIDKKDLRENLKYFLNRIMPICEKYGITMCIHPDDPPFQMLGLPRIVTNEDDIQWILDAVDNPHNGLTFCAGSLSTGQQNDVPAMAEKFASRTHFVHLRSTETLPGGNFMEASHLEGRGHLIQLVELFDAVNSKLPMRIDHGRMMLGDEDKGYNPGYSFHGRMLAFAQIEGVMAALKYKRSK